MLSPFKGWLLLYPTLSLLPEPALPPLHFRPLVLQVALRRTGVLQHKRSKNFPLIKHRDLHSRAVFSILYAVLPDGPLLLPPPSFHKTAHTAGPIVGFRVHKMLSYISHDVTRGVNIVPPSALQVNSQRQVIICPIICPIICSLDHTASEG